MPTVHRAGNLRFVVFPDDHGPPHVHVFAPGGSSRAGWAKLLLEGADGRPVLLWARGMDRGALRQAMAETLAHRGRLFLCWQRIHGSGRAGPEEG